LTSPSSQPLDPIPRLAINRCTRNLNPGGYIELFDTLNPLTSDDDSLPADSAIAKWNGLLVEASQKLGRPLDSSTKYRDQLTEAGFVNIVERHFKWPINTWPKDSQHKLCGAWSHENFLEGVQAVSLMLFTGVLGWSKEEIEVLLVDVRKDSKNRQIHAYWPMYVTHFYFCKKILTLVSDMSSPHRSPKRFQDQFHENMHFLPFSRLHPSYTISTILRRYPQS